jgi:iodotyrosine deiodinase
MYLMTEPVFLPLTTYREYSPDEMKDRIKTFRDDMLRRRTVRQFSSRPVPREVIEDCLRIAGTAPSGANQK